MGGNSARLSKFGMGMGLGVSWALGVFALGLLVAYCDLGQQLLDLLASVYKGYDSTLQGSAIGAAWGFVDGFVGGFILAMFYNLFRCGR